MGLEDEGREGEDEKYEERGWVDEGGEGGEGGASSLGR